MKAGQHIVSLSLGDATNPSGLIVVDPRTEFERVEDGEFDRKWDHENFFEVTHAARFPADRPTSTLATCVSEIMSDERLAKNCRLLLDSSLTGPASARAFERQGLDPKVIELTNSGSVDRVRGQAPLRDVIGAARDVQESNRLKVAEKLEYAEALVTDLLGYVPLPPSRNLDLRSGRNSDLVHALAVALWWADQYTWGDRPRAEEPRVASGPNAWMGS